MSVANRDANNIAGRAFARQVVQTAQKDLEANILKGKFIQSQLLLRFIVELMNANVVLQVRLGIFVQNVLSFG